MATKYRNYPRHTLEQARAVARTIRDNNAGRPMNRLLLAEGLGIKPSSSNYRDLLSSSLKYGLTNGTEKAAEVSLTELGTQATSGNRSQELLALRQAARTPKVFDKFYENFDNAKVPSADMLAKLLVADYEVPEDSAPECAELIIANGEKVGFVRPISGARYVMLSAYDDLASDQPSEEEAVEQVVPDGEGESGDDNPPDGEEESATVAERPNRLDDGATEEPGPPRAIFLGHGKRRGPLDKLVKILEQFKIPHRVATAEPNLGRPIPVKVRETMMQCGSAILIFTKDEKFTDADGNEIWRPSENVSHELGAASFLYEDRIVIFKEEGINLPTNYSSIGYISFEEDGIDAKTAELLQELIGFGLVKITAA